MAINTNLETSVLYSSMTHFLVFFPLNLSLIRVLQYWVTYVGWLESNSEYLLIQQLFIKNIIFHEKTEQCPTFPISYPEGSGMCRNVLSLNVCLQHGILGVVNTTVRHLLALLQYFGICDHQHASLEGWKDESFLVPRQTFKAFLSRLLQQHFLLSGCVGFYGTKWLIFFPPLKKHLDGHGYPPGTEIHEAVSHWFHL